MKWTHQLRDKIIEKLDKKAHLLEEDLMLVNGFIVHPISKEDNEILALDTCVASVMAIGKRTGIAHLFNFNELMKD